MMTKLVAMTKLIIKDKDGNKIELDFNGNDKHFLGTVTGYILKAVNIAKIDTYCDGEIYSICEKVKDGVDVRCYQGQKEHMFIKDP